MRPALKVLVETHMIVAFRHHEHDKRASLISRRRAHLVRELLWMQRALQMAENDCAGEVTARVVKTSHNLRRAAENIYPISK